MTMWSAIRGWFKPPAASAATESNTALVDDMFFSLDDGWMGLYSRSPDGRWVISWRDGHWAESASGRRRFHAGKFLLYDTRNEAVIVEQSAPRPQNGHVADNGTFLIEEWGDPSVLGTTIFAFDGAGRPVMKAGLSANVVVSAISAGGRYGMCQTASSSTEDSVKLMLFDLTRGTRVYAVVPEAGWPKQYTVDETTAEVIAHLGELGSFAYAADGQFRDAERLEVAQLTRGTSREVASAADRALREGSEDRSRVERAVRGLARSLAAHPWPDARERARALKTLGNLRETLHDAAHAIAAYDEALSLDAKVGVKRKLEALRKASMGR
jgi:hypothetical protein